MAWVAGPGRAGMGFRGTAGLGGGKSRRGENEAAFMQRWHSGPGRLHRLILWRLSEMGSKVSSASLT